MTLGTNEAVYQSDYMSVSPLADAGLYSLFGDRIINGLVANTSASGVTLVPGKAVLQGRLVEVKAYVTYPWPAGVTSGYIGLMADLTKTNVDNNDGTIVNNQYTIGIFTNITGNLTQGATKANIPLYAVSTTTATQGGLVNIMSSLTDKLPIQPSLAQGFIGYDSTAQPVAYRAVDGILYIRGAVKRTTEIASDNEVTVFTLPEDHRPQTRQNYVTHGSVGGKLLVTVQPTGEVTVSRYTFDGKTFSNFSTGSWINIGGSVSLV